MLNTLFTLYPELYTLLALCMIAFGFALVYTAHVNAALNYISQVRRQVLEFIYLNLEVSLRLVDVDDYNSHLRTVHVFRGYLSFNVFMLTRRDPIRLGYIKPALVVYEPKRTVDEEIYHESTRMRVPDEITDVRQIILMRMRQYAQSPINAEATH